MSNRRWKDEFNVEAVKQVLERGHGVLEVALWLGVNKHSLYDWVVKARLTKSPAEANEPAGSESVELRP